VNDGRSWLSTQPWECGHGDQGYVAQEGVCNAETSCAVVMNAAFDVQFVALSM